MKEKVAVYLKLLQLELMELDLMNVHFDLKEFKPIEIEEAMEDPFVVRLLPDEDREDGLARYYALGRTTSDRYLFIVFWTDGKIMRIIAVRDMTENELKFYDRKYAEFR